MFFCQVDYKIPSFFKLKGDGITYISNHHGWNSFTYQLIYVFNE